MYNIFGIEDDLKFENIVYDYKIFKKIFYNSDRFCNRFLSLID